MTLHPQLCRSQQVQRVGSDIVRVWGDRTNERGLATVGYDDDGVKTTMGNPWNGVTFRAMMSRPSLAGWVAGATAAVRWAG